MALRYSFTLRCSVRNLASLNLSGSSPALVAVVAGEPAAYGAVPLLGPRLIVFAVGPGLGEFNSSLGSVPHQGLIDERANIVGIYAENRERQLHRLDAVGLRPAPVSPTTPIIVLRWSLSTPSYYCRAYSWLMRYDIPIPTRNFGRLMRGLSPGPCPLGFEVQARSFTGFRVNQLSGKFVPSGNGQVSDTRA